MLDLSLGLGRGVLPTEACETSKFTNACFTTDLSGWLVYGYVATWNPDGSCDLSAPTEPSIMYQNFDTVDSLRYGLSLTGGSPDLFWLVNDALTTTPTTDDLFFDGVAGAFSIGVGSNVGAVATNIDSILFWEAGIPSTYVTYNGDLVTHNGEQVTYTEGE